MLRCDVAAFARAEQTRKQLESEIQKISADANALAKNSDLSLDDKKQRGAQLKAQRQSLSAQLAGDDCHSRAALIANP